MKFIDLLRRVVGVLDHTGIPYMLTGSFAGAFHGSMRATQDIDIVISPTADQVRAFVQALPRGEYYVDEGAALEALRLEGQFNVVDLDTGWKVDLVIRKSRPFSREEFERRHGVDYQGVPVTITTPEDLILAKLEWAKLAESQRQIEDAADLLWRRSRDLDRQYMEKWVGQLGLQQQWEAACRIAGLPGDADG